MGEDEKFLTQTIMSCQNSSTSEQYLSLLLAGCSVSNVRPLMQSVICLVCLEAFGLLEA